MGVSLVDIVPPVQALSSQEHAGIEAARRFPTLYTEISKRHHFRRVRTGKLTPIDTLDWNKVDVGMTVNALYVYDASATLWRTRLHDNTLFLCRDSQRVELARFEENKDGFLHIADYKPHVSRFIRGAYVVPVGPWGSRFSVMFIDFGTTHIDKENGYTPPAMNDLPDNVLQLVLPHQAGVVSHLAKSSGDIVLLGYCNSAAGVDPESVGLQTVLEPHGQVSLQSKDIFEKKGSRLPLSFDVIRQGRAAMPWDEGVSQYMADQAYTNVKSVIHRYWPIAEVERDNMGINAFLPGFTTDHLAELRFMREFWGPMSLTVHCHLKRNHAQMWPSDLDDAIAYVLSAHKMGTIDFAEFKRMFFPYMMDLPPQLQGVHKLRNAQINRKPYGWAGGMAYQEGVGLLVTITYGTMNIPTGVSEGNGVACHRPPEPMRGSELEYKDALHEEVTRRVVEGSKRFR